MATTRIEVILVSLLAVTAVVTRGSQMPLQATGSFTIETKATAAEQFEYASRISPRSDDLSGRNQLILQSVAALEVIPQRWPNERELSLRAYREMVSRLSGAQLHANAIAVCDKA